MNVVTFGEILLRLNLLYHERFIQTNYLDSHFGGGEVNVSVSLSNYGTNTKFVTKLPDNDLAQGIMNRLGRYGVDTSEIVRGGSRIGIYYCETGASQRPSNIIYDIAHSAIAEAKLTDFNWDKIFEDADLFHFSGITPALSENCAELCIAACRAAKRNNVLVSLHQNYRSKLWSLERARTVMERIIPYVDIWIGGAFDSENIYGISADPRHFHNGSCTRTGFTDIVRKMCEKYNIKYCVSTERKNICASINTYSAVLYNSKLDKLYSSRDYKFNIVDRVGGGDSFAGAFLYAMLAGMSEAYAIEFAAAAGTLKHTIDGDFNHISLEEVVKLVNGYGSGKVVW